MPSLGRRRVFQLDACFDSFIEKHWRDAHFLSITFAENVTDKARAERSWRPVREWFNRREVAYLGVWENQTRGAWHLHLLLSRYIDIRVFREFAVSVGWGPIMRIDRVTFKVDDFNAPDPKQLASQVDRVKRYLLKYLRKGQHVSGPRRFVTLPASHPLNVRHGGMTGAKLSVFSKACRRVTMAVSFTEDMAGRLFEAGREVFFSVYGRLPAWADYRKVMKLGFEILVNDPKWQNLLMWSPYEIEYG